MEKLRNNFDLSILQHAKPRRRGGKFQLTLIKCHLYTFASHTNVALETATYTIWEDNNKGLLEPLNKKVKRTLDLLVYLIGLFLNKELVKCK